MTPLKDGSHGSATGCYEVVPYAGQIWQRASAQVPAWRIASELGLPLLSVRRVVGICRRLGKPPSQERLCVCVLNHPDMSDEEVADLFGRNVRWVENVREKRQLLREQEPFDIDYEYLDDGLAITDPTPFEIEQVTSLIRQSWKDGVEGRHREGIDVPWRRASPEAHV